MKVDIFTTGREEGEREGVYLPVYLYLCIVVVVVKDYVGVQEC